MEDIILIRPEDIKCEGDRLTLLRSVLFAAGMLSDPDTADQAILDAYESEGKLRKKVDQSQIDSMQAQIEELKALIGAQTNGN